MVKNSESASSLYAHKVVLDNAHPSSTCWCDRSNESKYLCSLDQALTWKWRRERTNSWLAWHLEKHFTISPRLRCQVKRSLAPSPKAKKEFYPSTSFKLFRNFISRPITRRKSSFIPLVPSFIIFRPLSQMPRSLGPSSNEKSFLTDNILLARSPQRKKMSKTCTDFSIVHNWNIVGVCDSWLICAWHAPVSPWRRCWPLNLEYFISKLQWYPIPQSAKLKGSGWWADSLLCRCLWPLWQKTCCTVLHSPFHPPLPFRFLSRQKESHRYIARDSPFSNAGHSILCFACPVRPLL